MSKCLFDGGMVSFLFFLFFCLAIGAVTIVGGFYGYHHRESVWDTGRDEQER